RVSDTPPPHIHPPSLHDALPILNKRRGRVMGMNPDGEGNQIVEAEVPMAEMGRYAIDLRSMTQGRGSFTFHFVRYEDAPPAAQEDRKSTRLNSSHVSISYAVFCL